MSSQEEKHRRILAMRELKSQKKNIKKKSSK